MGQVCRLFGKSRQAYYQLEKRRTQRDIGEEMVLMYVRGIRVSQPRMGTRKLYWLLKAVMYVSTEEGFVYVSLVTDQYSKKIMGYSVYATLEAEGPLQALRMALKNRSHSGTRLIHHSDRGIQYCSEEYIGLLERNGFQISMSAPGNPYENAVSERVNGIVKTEFYSGTTVGKSSVNEIKVINISTLSTKKKVAKKKLLLL